MPIYLDYNATTPVAPEVLEAMQPYWTEEFGNAGSRTHFLGNRAAEAVEKARLKISESIKAHPGEVIFTSGATESNNIALLGIAHNDQHSNKKHIISTAIEHKSILEPLDFLSKRGYTVDIVSPENNGRINPNDILSKVREDTLLISIMHVNNETGVIQPITEICDALNMHAVYIHTDASQGFGKINKHLTNKRIDLISISGHKIFGPKGIGALVRRRRKDGLIPISPLMMGGGQEKGIRPGTLPVPLIVGLAKASEYSQKLYLENSNKYLNVKNIILSKLFGLNYKINGDQIYTMNHVINISFKGIDSEALMILLKDDVCISNGSACTSSNHKQSHVLKAMGLQADEINGAIRISWLNANIPLEWIDSIQNKVKLLQCNSIN